MPRAAKPLLDSLSGRVLGRYRLGERLGAGGAAAVYLALLKGPHTFERVLAIKVVHEHLAESKDFVNMFLDEANLAVRLQHPNIVHTYELGRDGPYLFLAMELLAGQPLSRLLERVQERGQTLAPGLVAWIGARAAAALAYAHAVRDDAGKRMGLVHRDISPQNVFLTYDGRVLLIDWGIALSEGRLTHTGVGRLKGKLSYMSPEQMLGRPVDHKVDIFSLGATLYEAALGFRPFEGENEAETIAKLIEEDAPSPETRVPGFPADLSRILLRALARESRDRYPDAGELAKDLERAAARVADPAANLAAQLAGLFATEREEQARAVVRLKALAPVRAIHAPAGATTTADPMASSVRPRPRSSRRYRLMLGAAAATLALALLVTSWIRRGTAEPITAAHGPPTESVDVDVRVEPPVEAIVLLDGKERNGARVRIALDRSAHPATLTVRAPGFESSSVAVVPDEDQVVVVRLSPRTEAGAAGNASPGKGDATNPVAKTGQQARAVRAPAPAGSPRAPSPEPAKKDSLVTEYPF